MKKMMALISKGVCALEDLATKDSPKGRMIIWSFIIKLVTSLRIISFKQQKGGNNDFPFQSQVGCTCHRRVTL